MTNLKDFSENLLEEIKKAESIAVISHFLPDGDAIGSTLSIYSAVREINPNVRALKSDEIPYFLEFLPLAGELELYDGKEKFDLTIILDCADENRLGGKKSIIENSRKSFLVDHHNNNSEFADYNYVDNKSSSTCEIVFDIVKYFGLEFSKDFAMHCLTGILTDTNRFMYENCKADTFRKAADLLDTGIDKDFLIRNLYQKTSMNSFLLNKTLVEKTDFYFDGKFALSYISKEDLDEISASRDDLDDKISQIRDIEGVEVAILVEDRFGELKVGLRSKEYVNVSSLARKYGGGGHNKAAGFYYKSSYDELNDSLLKEVESLL